MAATATSANPIRPAAGQSAVSGRFNPRQLEFLRDPASGRVAVRSIDTVTGEVRTIPPEVLLATMANIRRAIGLILDSQA
jgi:uncharacterized FlaG/YvyC family protein